MGVTSHLDQLLNKINSSISHADRLTFKSTPIDSITFVRNPRTIFEIQKNYDEFDQLQTELEELTNLKIVYITDLTFSILYHMHINDTKIDSANIAYYTERLMTASENAQIKREEKLCKYVRKNYAKFQVGDQLQFVLEIEKDSEGKRSITYGSFYDQLHPKSIFQDSVRFSGILLEKGTYQYFDQIEYDSTDCSSTLFKIKLHEISDTTFDHQLVSINQQIQIDEVFYLDLYGFGCRDLNQK